MDLSSTFRSALAAALILTGPAAAQTATRAAPEQSVQSKSLAAPAAPLVTQVAVKGAGAPSPGAKGSEPADALLADAVREVVKADPDAEYGAAASLNSTVTARNAAVEQRNAEARARYQAQQQAYEAELNRRKMIAADQAAAAAEAQRRYQQQMREWQARVAACNAGDVTQCGGS